MFNVRLAGERLQCIWEMAVYLAVADDVTSAILYREVPHMLHAKYQPN